LKFVQHTVIAQLMVDNGGLFDSWEPYAPYRSLTVHFGFSSFAALLSWFTSMDSVRATLLMGQLISGLAVITLYPLAMRLTNGNRWAALGAVLVAGLLSPMPAYYVNWGRYAQLAGQPFCLSLSGPLRGNGGIDCPGSCSCWWDLSSLE
jgi:hypothetical protein